MLPQSKPSRRTTIFFYFALLCPLFSCLAFWFWPIRPSAEWDPSPDAIIVDMTYYGPPREDDEETILRVWGNGHLSGKTYIKSESVYKPFSCDFSPDILRSKLEQLIRAGFFDHRIGSFTLRIAGYTEV